MNQTRARLAEQAAQKYQGDKQVSEFLREFMGLMGDHFGNLADEADAKERKEAKKGQAKRARDRYSHWRSHSPVPATLGPLLFGTPDYCALPLQPGRRRHRG